MDVENIETSFEKLTPPIKEIENKSNYETLEILYLVYIWIIIEYEGLLLYFDVDAINSSVLLDESIHFFSDCSQYLNIRNTCT